MQCAAVSMSVFIALEVIHHLSPILAFGEAIGGVLTASACLIGINKSD